MLSFTCEIFGLGVFVCCTSSLVNVRQLSSSTRQENYNMQCHPVGTTPCLTAAGILWSCGAGGWLVEEHAVVLGKAGIAYHSDFATLQLLLKHPNPKSSPLSPISRPSLGNVLFCKWRQTHGGICSSLVVAGNLRDMVTAVRLAVAGVTGVRCDVSQVLNCFSTLLMFSVIPGGS